MTAAVSPSWLYPVVGVLTEVRSQPLAVCHAWQFLAATAGW